MCFIRAETLVFHDYGKPNYEKLLKEKKKDAHKL